MSTHLSKAGVWSWAARRFPSTSAWTASAMPMSFSMLSEMLCSEPWVQGISVAISRQAIVRWQDADSVELLRMIFEMVRRRGLPGRQLRHHGDRRGAEAGSLQRPDSSANLSEILEVSVTDVSLKATTHEGLGTSGPW